MTRTQTRGGTIGGSRPRRAGWFYLLGSALAVLAASRVPAVATGDAVDYALMLQAFVDHGTPDVRPEDRRRVRELFESAGLPYADSTAFLRSPKGPSFGIHFWFYPLLAVPFRLALRLAGGLELVAFPMTNVALLAGALWLVLGAPAAAPAARRRAFAALAVASPVLLYVRWMAPEVFTFACVMVALAALGDRRYGLSAAAASCGSMQNAPVAALAALAILLSLRERRIRATAFALAGSLLAALPVIFNLHYFGRLNLISGTGMADARLVSVERTVSLLFDLNQGLLPYVPVTLLLGGAGLVLAALRRDVATLLTAACVALMALGTQAAVNWNCASAGMMRYAVWLLPGVAWLAASIPVGRLLSGVVVVGSLAQAAVALRRGDHDACPWLTRPAAFVLAHAPALYDPEPEIFAERQLHRDWLGRPPVPVAFATADGRITKLLVDTPSLVALPELYDVEPDWYASISRRHRTRGGLFYLEPPEHAVRSRPLPSPEALARVLRLSPVPRPTHATPGLLRVYLWAHNVGDRPVWGAMLGDRVLGLRSRRAGEAADLYVRALPLVMPGTSGFLFVDLVVPERPGRHAFTIETVQGDTALPGPSISLTVDISDPGVPAPLVWAP